MAKRNVLTALQEQFTKLKERLKKAEHRETIKLADVAMAKNHDFVSLNSQLRQTRKQLHMARIILSRKQYSEKFKVREVETVRAAIARNQKLISDLEAQEQKQEAEIDSLRQKFVRKVAT